MLRNSINKKHQWCLAYNIGSQLEALSLVHENCIYLPSNIIYSLGQAARRKGYFRTLAAACWMLKRRWKTIQVCSWATTFPTGCRSPIYGYCSNSKWQRRQAQQGPRNPQTWCYPEKKASTNTKLMTTSFMLKCYIWLWWNSNFFFFFLLCLL